MSLADGVDGARLYDLELLNSEGVFCKYKVKDFVVKSEDAVRYYNISAIYRVWDASIDDETGNDNTKDGVAFSAGKLFRAKTENEQIQYYCENVDVIQIINPYVDFLEYYNGFKFCPDWCRSHYVAFSTDRQIDTLKKRKKSLKENVLHTCLFSEYLPSEFSTIDLNTKLPAAPKSNIIAPVVFTMDKHNDFGNRRYISIPEVGSFLNAVDALLSLKANMIM